MKALRGLSLSLLCVAGVAGAADEPFNGSQPMVCEPTSGHDCLPTEKSCKPLKAEAGKKLELGIDVTSMAIQSPYRTSTLPIQSFSFNTKSLVLQGTSLELVWSATVNRTTGRLTMAIADREGAYVIFGQCKLGKPAPKQQ
jgi:hypothetical protein